MPSFEINQLRENTVRLGDAAVGWYVDSSGDLWYSRGDRVVCVMKTGEIFSETTSKWARIEVFPVNVSIEWSYAE